MAAATAWGCLAICLVLIVGCTQQMAEQPRCGPLEVSTFFADGRCARYPVEGTVARGSLPIDESSDAASTAQQSGDALPFSLSRQLLERGQGRYNIYCSPCHDRLGSGQGMIVRRGFSAPPSLHSERLRQAPLRHFFEVMTNGYGTMPDYAAQVSPHDRWAIAAYIQALQLSQHASLTDVPEEASRQLQDQKP
jgi:mono/diheme cytochrome c family protein